MPNMRWRILTVSDELLFEALRSIWVAHGSPDNHSIHVVLGDGRGGANANGRIPQLEKAQWFVNFLESGTVASQTMGLSVPGPPLFNVSVTRDFDVNALGTDLVSMSAGDDLSPDVVAGILVAVRKALPPYGANHEIDAALGPAMGEFYRRRDATVRNLEKAIADLVKQGVDFRRELDERASEERARLHAEVAAERERLQAYIDQQSEDIQGREAKLAERQKDLDDRSNTHVRREILRGLKATFAKRAESFGLTKETEAKRKTTHAGLRGLILFAGAVAVVSTIETVVAFWNAPQPTAAHWVLIARSMVTAIAFAAALVYYIRWSDSWSERHAAEEFKLKRLEIDMDRAAWVVEMALEWKDEKGSQIPPELVLQLTRNLFADDAAGGRVQHPAEDLAAAIFGSASSLKLALPGGAEAAYDRKGVQRLTKPE